MSREHRIPTIIGSILLLAGLTTGLLLVQKGPYFFLKAAPDITPTEVKVTNVTDSSFSISWITNKETTAFVRLADNRDSLNQTVIDDRDSDHNQTGAYTTHHLTAKNLKSKTKYYFRLGSGGRLFDSSGQPYDVTTATTPSGPLPPSDLASGVIFNASNQKTQEAIVYLSMTGMTPQSALVGSDGRWLIMLGTAFSQNLGGFAQYDHQAQIEDIFVQGGPAGTATAVTTTENDNPLPDIVLGKTYDFRRKTNEAKPSGIPTPGTLSPTPEASAASKFSLSPLSPATPATASGRLDVLNPAKEGEDLSTTKPEFRGTGPAGKTIKILVESANPYTGTVTVKKDGTWNWSLPTNLAPGEHKITISYLGQTFTRNFTVLAADSSLPAFTATPSATPTTSSRLTPTPTPTRALIPTPTRSLTPTATASATRTPTATPTPLTRTSMPSTASGIPQTGGLVPTFVLLFLGSVMVLGSLFWKNRASNR